MSKTLGVKGVDRPALVPAGVTLTPLSNVGVLFLAQRGIAEVVEMTNSPGLAKRFGDYVSAYYGKYCLEGLFKNLKGTPARIFGRRFVASNAVEASRAVQTADAQAFFSFFAGQPGSTGIVQPDKGVWGNKVGFSIAKSNRFTSAMSSSGASAARTISVNGVVNFEVGDIVEIGSGTTAYNKVESKDESNGTLTLVNTLGSIFQSGARIRTVNFDVAIYKKNAVGVLGQPVESFSNLSISPETSTYFKDVFNGVIGKGSYFMGVTAATPAPTGDYDDLQPAETGGVVFLSGGLDGDAPTASNWLSLISEFNTKPCRFLFCPENTSETLNKEAETLCKTIGDRIWLVGMPKDQSYEELQALGAAYVKSNDAYYMNNAQWIKVSDPIGIGLEPTKEIPNTGHVLGHMIYRIIKYGYQRVPAGVQETLDGVLGVVGDQIEDDVQRTVLADLGMNMVQYISGSGVVLRNARMCSTNRAYKWFNQIFMRIVYKKSFEESFRTAENDETGQDILDRLRSGMREFMFSDYRGNSRTGGKCAFLQYGDLKFEDVVKLIVDESNNSLDDVLNGNVYADVYFTPPAPAEAIEIGVGISLELSLGKTA